MSRHTLQKNLAYDDLRKRYYVTYYEGDHRRTKTFLSYTDAFHFLNQVQQALHPNPTLAQWLSWWITTEVEPHRAESTVYGYRNIIRLHLVPALGSVPLAELSPIQIQSYFSALLRKGLSPNTVRKHDNLLRTTLKRAIALHILSENPMSSVFAPQTRDPRYTCYSPQQLRILFQVVQGSRLELPVKLAAYLGMRRSEITGLRWQCVDFQEKILVIQEVRTEVGGHEVSKLPKTKSSIRKLSFGGSQDLVCLLQRLYQQNLHADPTDYVVCNPDGTVPSPDDLTHTLLQVVRTHGLPPITLHGLRHSFASVANSQGATLYDISHALGHSSITVTSKIYVHLFQQAEQRTMNMVAQAIDPLPEQNPVASPYSETGLCAAPK